MVGVECTDGNDLHTGSQDGIAVELLLEPELLKSHFAAALYLGFVFATFFLLNLHRRFGTAMLKLNLS